MIGPMFAYGIYRGILFPIAYVLLHVLAPVLPTKIREMLKDRRSPRQPPLLTAPIWIHAASGEIEYAKSVIREVKEKYPSIPILVTYFSPSAKKLIQGFPGVDLLVPLPWDRPNEAHAFFNVFKPRAGLFARTDVWPSFATVARSRKIPLLLFSATLSRKSARAGGPFGRWLKIWTFSRLEAIYCVSDEDARNFQSLGRLPVQVAGDSRYDQVFARLSEPSKLPPELAPAQDDFVFVMGSTWSHDEEILLSDAGFYLRDGIRPILVPHETKESHLAEIESRLQKQNLKWQRSSKAAVWNRDEILLVDQVGILADLYRWGRLAFVGGSFKDKVHSVMEPLAAGLPVLVGPHHLNNREAVQFQGTRLASGDTAVRVIQNPTDLRERVSFWRTKPDPRQEIRDLVRQRTGASKKVLAWVEHALKLSSLP